MNQISNVNGVNGITPLQQRSSAVAEGPSREGRVVLGDEVEISEAWALLARVSELPVRLDMVVRIRAEIADGTYETPERLDLAVERLLEELRS